MPLPIHSRWTVFESRDFWWSLPAPVSHFLCKIRRSEVWLKTFAHSCVLIFISRKPVGHLQWSHSCTGLFRACCFCGTEPKPCTGHSSLCSGLFSGFWFGQQDVWTLQCNGEICGQKAGAAGGNTHLWSWYGRWRWQVSDWWILCA